MPEFKTIQFDDMRDTLIELGKKIKKENYPHDVKNWQGADVVIVSKLPLNADKGLFNFYPPPRYVVTRFSNELSWLFEQLRDAFYRYHFIDSCSKIEFFGRLANMANHYLKKVGSDAEKEQDLLLAVLHESFSILEEMEDGDFQFLEVAIGNTIFDDLIERTETNGYLGVEETKQFLTELERRYQNVS